MVPDLGAGTHVSLPLLSDGLRVVGGLQLQTWPVYWGRAEAGETCTYFEGGDQKCSSFNDIPRSPSRLKLLFTPSAGVAARFGMMTLHAQGFVHTGSSELGRNPYGGMLAIEYWFAGTDEE